MSRRENLTKFYAHFPLSKTMAQWQISWIPHLSFAVKALLVQTIQLNRLRLPVTILRFYSTFLVAFDLRYAVIRLIVNMLSQFFPKGRFIYAQTSACALYTSRWKFKQITQHVNNISPCVCNVYAWKTRLFVGKKWMLSHQRAWYDSQSAFLVIIEQTQSIVYIGNSLLGAQYGTIFRNLFVM